MDRPTVEDLIGHACSGAADVRVTLRTACAETQVSRLARAVDSLARASEMLLADVRALQQQTAERVVTYRHDSDQNAHDLSSAQSGTDAQRLHASNAAREATPLSALDAALTAHADSALARELHQQFAEIAQCERDTCAAYRLIVAALDGDSRSRGWREVLADCATSAERRAHNIAITGAVVIEQAVKESEHV